LGVGQMTQPEQDAALGGLVKTYSAAKQKRVAIMSELHKLGGLLRSVGYSIEMHQLEFRQGKTQAAVPSEYPSAERLNELLQDFDTTSGVIEECKKLLTEAGLSIT
jgi:hypothetical protein